MSNIWSRLINLAGNITGVLPVANGGTALSAGTDGGILGFTATGTLASSALLVNHAVMVGAGTGATPKTITAGTNGQLLVGVTSADPAFGSTVSAATTFSGGTAFGGTTTAASGASGTQTNMNWYEQGTWTPVLNGNGGSALSSVTAVGQFVRIGNLVMYSGYYAFTVPGDISGSNLGIGGLPYTSNSTANFYNAVHFGQWGKFTAPASTQTLGGYVNTNSAIITLQWNSSVGSVPAAFTASHFNGTSGHSMLFSGTFRI